MIFDFRCTKCNKVFEQTAELVDSVSCSCGGMAKRLFKATDNFYVPLCFHTNKSDIFDYQEWRDLKKNPDIERAR